MSNSALLKLEINATSRLLRHRYYRALTAHPNSDPDPNTNANPDSDPFSNPYSFVQRSLHLVDA